MKRRWWAALGVSAFAVCVPPVVQADPVHWSTTSGGNGHYYDFVAGGIGWTSAEAAAAASSFQGQSGYLATITSEAEWDFLKGLPHARGWLGGSDAAVEGEWRWVTGPEIGQPFWDGGISGTSHGFSAWRSGEPNNWQIENYLEVGADSVGNAWNDNTLAGPSDGYYVEYGGEASTIPEPSTMVGLVSMGLMGLAIAWRRRRTK
ncbi:MAG: PEP-CTERM sorting domain-containing protein [Planctomycetes bacterium]|nr:PEP-CTERM sorting domain-containing protein [Planctomycetota bacterium]